MSHIQSTNSCISTYERQYQPFLSFYSPTRASLEITMPRPQTVYSAVIKVPRETIEFQMPSGSSEAFEIWQDDVSNVELIKCDLCGQFVPLQIPGQTKKSTSQMKRHRDSKLCQKLVEKNNLVSEPISFTFLQGWPQSQIISESLSHGQANFYCSINLQVLILFNYLEGSTTPSATPFSNITPHASPNASQIDLTSGFLPPSSLPSSPELDVGFNMGSGSIENLCKGQVVKWTAGSIWETYAYHQHDDGEFGWIPIGYEGHQLIRLQSKNCIVNLRSDIEFTCQTCNSCFSLLIQSNFCRAWNGQARILFLTHHGNG